MQSLDAENQVEAAVGVGRDVEHAALLVVDVRSGMAGARDPQHLIGHIDSQHSVISLGKQHRVSAAAATQVDGPCSPAGWELGQ